MRLYFRRIYARDDLNWRIHNFLKIRKFMNQGKYVFAQIGSFLPQRVFDTIVNRYNGDYRVRHFTCWNQLLCMMYGQLSNRDSLSDLVLTVNAHSQRHIILGLEKGFRKRILENRMRIVIGGFTTIFPIILLRKQERFAWQMIQLNFHFLIPCTLLTPRLSIYAWMYFARLLFEGLKEPSNYIPSMM